MAVKMLVFRPVSFKTSASTSAPSTAATVISVTSTAWIRVLMASSNTRKSKMPLEKATSPSEVRLPLTPLNVCQTSTDTDAQVFGCAVRACGGPTELKVSLYDTDMDEGEVEAF
jgi:hypothetical protein